MPKPSLSPATVKAALVGKWRPVTDLVPMIEGKESDAYCFRTASGTYIVRVNRTRIAFEKDAFVQRRFAKSTLPIPEVLEIGETDFGYAYCISERVPGVTLQDLSARDLPSVLAPTAKVMNAIATCGLDGFSGSRPIR